MTQLEKLMDDYYNTLTNHKAKLDYTYNRLVEMWGKSKKAKTITFVEEKDYKEATPIIFNKEKFYVIGLDLSKEQVNVRICNHQTEETIMDEIKWYGNHDLKTLIIDEVAKHLGYCIEIGGEFKQEKKKKK